MRENGLYINIQPNYPVQPTAITYTKAIMKKKQLEVIRMKIESRIDRKAAFIWSEFMSILCINKYHRWLGNLLIRWYRNGERNMTAGSNFNNSRWNEIWIWKILQRWKLIPLLEFCFICDICENAMNWKGVYGCRLVFPWNLKNLL